MKTRRTFTRLGAAALGVTLAVALAGCKAKSHGTPAGGGPDDGFVPDTAPFAEAVGPFTYVPKVKTLLTGQAATDAEVQAVVANPAALRTLIDQWMTTQEFRDRMVDFFRNAFQQNRVSLDALSSSLDIPDFYLGERETRLEQAIVDAFPLTAWQLVQEGRPFHETVTTRRYLLSTAVLAALSYSEMFDVDDAGRTIDRLSKVTSAELVVDPFAAHSDGTPYTYAESFARYRPGLAGTWTWRLPVDGMTPECEALIRTMRGTPESPGPQPSFGVVRPGDDRKSATLLGYMFGGLNFDPTSGTTCQRRGAQNVRVPQLQEEDWNDWRMVTVETTPLTDRDALPAPLFFDLAGLRAATTVRLKAPHVGFLGTLAWFANWATNESNQARVTANQALIVALGRSILPAAAIAPAPVNDSDAAHSTDPACAACHRVLDPLRQFFRQSYTFSYHEQRDLTEYLGNAAFLLGGMDVTGHGVEDLATILAGHPHFALGWAQKLQFWANGTPADESDPELLRIARRFEASGFDFRVLVREVFSSPLVTLASGTATRRNETVTAAMARRDQLCASLSTRLGITDACEQREQRGWGVRGASQMIATDTYYRAAELPALPRDPDLFFRNSVELLCGRLANQVVDAGSSPRYRSDTPAAVEAALADLVGTIMNLPPSDPRAGPAAGILRAHYAEALTQTAAWNRTGALRSTFILACTSPSSVLVGL